MDPHANQQPPVSRQAFLKLGLGAIAAGASGCDAFSTEPAGSKKPAHGSTNSGDDQHAKQAPRFARLVKEGKLPALADRLPQNSLIVEPVDKPGIYGGTWRTAMVGSADTPWMQRTMNWEPAIRHNPAWTKQLPNVAE